MRFELVLSLIPKERGTLLPLNYQYELSSWIYKVLNYGDPIFSEWLHTMGYKSKEKPFKLFTFSNLEIPTFQLNGDLLKIDSNEIKFIISFLTDDAISPFITGLFKERHLVLGNKSHQVAFNVSQVIGQPKLEIAETMRFQTISPLFVDEFNPSTGKTNHLSPDACNYSALIHNTLKEKYRAFYNQEPNPEWPETKIIAANKPKSKLITIKSDTPEMTKIKAYNFQFSVTGQPELITVGYYGGFGRLGSQGFGCVEKLHLQNG
jgi:CRISPR-associated endoribonuclease Cas6